MGNEQKTKAFTLMVVVSVLTVFSSVVIGFSLLSVLNRKKSNALKNSPFAIAKSNAIRALNQALSHLQQDAAIDTLSTARADIFPTCSDDKKYWIGSWTIDKVPDEDVTSNDAVNFRSWLVSGNFQQESDVLCDFDEEPKIAILPQKLYPETDPVYIPLIDNYNSYNKIQGQYAYWVDDESLKASCNLNNPGNSFKNLFSTETHTASRFFFVQRQCPAAMGMPILASSLFSDEELDHFPISVTQANADKKIAGNILYSDWITDSQFSADNKISLQKGYHDITSRSIGLFTDARCGGFKQNFRRLTHDNYLSSKKDDEFMFPAPDAQDPAPPPTWAYFKSFIYLGTQRVDDSYISAQITNPQYRPQTGVNYSDCQLISSSSENETNSTEIWTVQGNHAEDLGIPSQYGIFPIITGAKVYYSMIYSNLWGPYQASNYNWNYFALYACPVFQIFNPYCIPIKMPSGFKLIQCSPYVSSLESNNSTAIYNLQKTPHFKISIKNDSGTVYASGLSYESSLNQSTSAGTEIFPFKDIEPDLYMRYIWKTQCSNDVTLGNNTSPFLFSLTLDERKSFLVNKIKSLDLPFLNSTRDFSAIAPISSDMDQSSTTRRYSDIRFYQETTYRNALGTSVEINSWPNSTNDPWNNIALRLTDAKGNIYQQISDILMESPFNSNPRWHSFKIPIQKNYSLWMNCFGRRNDPDYNTAETYAVKNPHGYNPIGLGSRPIFENNPVAPFNRPTPWGDYVTSSSYSNNTIPGNGGWGGHWLDMISDFQALSLAPTKNSSHVDFLTQDYHSSFDNFKNLFDLPDPKHWIHNIGFLQHFNVGCFSYHPPFQIGNSFQNPWIPRNCWFYKGSPVTGSIWPSHNKVAMLYDYSFILNRTLWDSYFVSEYAFHNARFFQGPRNRALLDASPDDFGKYGTGAAEHSVFNGAFNINSTSIPAWTAFLGSTLNLFTNDNCVQYSHIHSLSSVTPATIGRVDLSFAKTKELATKIVEQIKLRGPSAGVGAFINRKLISASSDTHKLGLKGAIQSAIDNTDINSSFNDKKVTSRRNKPWFDDEAASGAFWLCQSGYLTQADMLQSLGNGIVCRGDTFCIHAYGNALDDSGKIIAEVRCEAVVQRTTKPYAVNEENGRQFKILTIKWIQ